MPPRCWLAQSDGARGGLTSPPSMRKFQRVSNLPASPSRWTLVQYGTGPMSALGQKRTCALHQRMSALPPIATSIAFFGMSALGQKRTPEPLTRSYRRRGLQEVRKNAQFIEAKCEGGASPCGTISCVILTEKGDNFRECM